MWLLFAVGATVMNALIAYTQYAKGEYGWAMFAAAAAGFGVCWISDLILED